MTVGGETMPELKATNATQCPTCASSEASAASPSYIYAIGKIQPRFPLLSIEKELAQAAGRSVSQGLTDPQAFHHALTRPENRYLVRQLCWVMTIAELETYILVPRDPSDWHLLVESVRPRPGAADVDVVIGSKGPVAPPTSCNGLMVPIVPFDQIYSFNVDALFESIPRPENVEAEQFRTVAAEVFDRVIQLADNAGGSDEHRAVNYLLMRYPGMYAVVADAHARNASMTAIEVQLSPLSGTRRIVDVIFSFNNRATDVGEKYAVRVDVTEKFPFLVSKISPYFDRS
jgi:PatG C-terminal